MSNDSNIESWESLYDEPETKVQPTIIIPVILPSIDIKNQDESLHITPTLEVQKSGLPTKTKKNKNNIQPQEIKIQKPERIYTQEEEKLREKIKDYKRRSAVDNKFASKKVGFTVWNIIANGVSKDDKDLWATLYNIGAGINHVTEMKINAIGDELYLTIRKDLKFLMLENKNFNVADSRRLSKVEQMKSENIKKSLLKDFEALKHCIDNKFELSLNHKFAEINIVKLMIYLNQRIDEVEITEIIVAYNKFLNNTANTQISNICLDDLRYLIRIASTKCKFNSLNLIKNNPKLIFKTKYDNINNIVRQKVYNLTTFQRDILDFVKNNKKGLALVYSMLGSGKTTIVPVLCGYLNSLQNNTCKIIYTCPNDAIIIEVSRMVYSLSLPFAIVIYNQKTNTLDYKFSDFANDNQKKKKNVIYICDIFVARKLLEERKDIIDQHNYFMKIDGKIPIGVLDIPNYMLITDEPTKDADTTKNFQCDDVNFSLNTEVFIDHMKLAPDMTIVMSATLPKYEELKDLYDMAAKGSPIRSFTSSESKVGCNLINSNGEIYIPHTRCKNKTEINHLLEVIQTNPFIGRFYTFDVLLYLIDIYRRYNLIVPDLTLLLDNPSKATQKNIQEMTIEMLKQLDDELINKIKYHPLKLSEGMKLETILSTDISKINRTDQTCILFTLNPLNDSIKIYTDNFGTDIFKNTKIDHIISDYDKKKQKYKEQIERLENKADEGTIVSGMSTADNKTILINKLKENPPVWDFPEKYQLCSESHLREYKSESKTSRNIIPENIPKLTVVSNEVLTQMASGIGIYDTTDPNLDDDYLENVLSLAKNNQLKVINSNNSIAYGTNLAVTEIGIDDKKNGIVDKHSMKTIFQILGRAGRGGNLSYKANIYGISHDHNLINKIDLYIRGELDEGEKDEVQNIKRAFELLC
jgi:hypothetical protein